MSENVNLPAIKNPNLLVATEGTEGRLYQLVPGRSRWYQMCLFLYKEHSLLASPKLFSLMSVLSWSPTQEIDFYTTKTSVSQFSAINTLLFDKNQDKNNNI